MFMHVSGPELAPTPLVYAPAKYTLTTRYFETRSAHITETTVRQARRTSAPLPTSEYEHRHPLALCFETHHHSEDTPRHAPLTYYAALLVLIARATFLRYAVMKSTNGNYFI